MGIQHTIALNQAYDKGLIAGAELADKPNRCQTADRVYEITFKQGLPYIATTDSTPLLADIDQPSEQSFLYTAKQETKAGSYRYTVWMYYPIKKCIVFVNYQAANQGEQLIYHEHGDIRG